MLGRNLRQRLFRTCRITGVELGRHERKGQLVSDPRRACRAPVDRAQRGPTACRGPARRCAREGEGEPRGCPPPRARRRGDTSGVCCRQRHDRESAPRQAPDCSVDSPHDALTLRPRRKQSIALYRERSRRPSGRDTVPAASFPPITYDHDSRPHCAGALLVIVLVLSGVAADLQQPRPLRNRSKRVRTDRGCSSSGATISFPISSRREGYMMSTSAKPRGGHQGAQHRGGRRPDRRQ